MGLLRTPLGRLRLLTSPWSLDERDERNREFASYGRLGGEIVTASPFAQAVDVYVALGVAWKCIPTPVIEQTGEAQLVASPTDTGFARQACRRNEWDSANGWTRRSHFMLP